MKYILILFALIFASLKSFAGTECQPLTSASFDSSLKTTTCYQSSFHSKSVKRNVGFNIIIPRGYSSSNDPMPYAVFLHGRGGDRNHITSIDAVSILDQDIRDGGAPFLIFSPNGGNHYWMNAAISKEKWGDMITKDLIEYIEKNFNVVKNEPCKRALFGISMGGNGVLQLALNNPDLFCTGFALSPVFRTPKEIWTPSAPADSNLPKEDYDSYGTGKDYEARSARNLCEKRKKETGTCLPFKNFRLVIGNSDPMLGETPDTRTFIEDLAKMHSEFEIGIKNCTRAEICGAHKDCNAHSASYWKCQLPEVMTWLSAQLKK